MPRGSLQEAVQRWIAPEQLGISGGEGARRKVVAAPVQRRGVSHFEAKCGVNLSGDIQIYAMKSRQLRERIVRRFGTRLGRLLVLTGARQTGKTTLARNSFPDLPYLSMEDPILRPTYSRMASAEWIDRFPMAIIDEVQKAATLVETIKAA
jgi:hypothetical protein